MVNVHPPCPDDSARILIVDDTPANLRLLANVLTKQGYSVRLAPSGALALMAIQRSLPDIILLDICMPNMDGFDVCEVLKSQATTCDIPVIFLSALQDSSDKAKAFEKGGADYITKPFQAEEVLARVRHHLHTQQLQARLKEQQQLLVAQNQQLKQEIRDRERAEAALSQERNLLRNLIDAIPDFVFYKDPQGRYQLCNQAFADFVGRSPEAILQHSDTDLFSQAAAAWVQSKDQKALATRSPLRHEEWATFNTGHRRLLDTYKVPLIHPEGEVYGLIGICRDITDLKAAETQLSRTASRLSTLISGLQAGILVEDENRQIVLANQWLCDLFHIPMAPAELVGLNCETVASNLTNFWADADAELQRINEILQRHQPIAAEELLLADGRIFERDYIPIVSGTNFQGHLWQYRDITSRKANERALIQVSQALTDFSESLKQLHRLSLKRFHSFEELAEDYLQTGCQVLGFAGGAIGMLQGDQYVVAAVQSSYQELYPNFSCCLADTLCGKAITSGKTITYAHIGGLPEMQNHPIYLAFGWESFLSTPIFVDGQIYGSLCFFAEVPRQQGFTNHEQEFIELMAQSIGKFLLSHRVEQQQQQAKAALRESEARFRQLAENIENLFWIREPHTQTFTYVSPAYERIWQRPCAALLEDPATWQQSLYGEDQQRMVAKQAAGDSYDEEYRIVWPDGTVRWIRDRAFPIRNENDEVYRVVGIAEDITDLKHQEQALRLVFEGTAAKTGRAFFRSLVRYLAQVLQVRYVLIGQKINDQQLQVLALWSDNHFKENTILNLLETPCEQVIAGETLFYPEALQEQYPETKCLIDWAAMSYFGVPLTNNNNTIIGHLAVFDDRPMHYDKTRELILQIFAVRAGAELERQTFEAEIQAAREIADAANRAKSEFLANISHELRTPLNTILGFTQLALNACQAQQDSAEYLNIVSRSGEHLLTLINDVLEMSKIEAGKATFRPQQFDLYALLQSLSEMFSLRAQIKHLSFTITHPETLPQYIETDESKLRQVLINLLSNAVKFTETGGIRMEVERVCETAAYPTQTTADTMSSQSSVIVLAFTVTDTGPGMTPEEEKLLFEPFVQTTAGYRSQEGTGLGLPISQQFVQLMGGQIQVRTAPHQGSTFAFKIPVLIAEPKSIGRKTDVRQTFRFAAEAGKYRILVVDDNSSNRQLLVHILKHAGFPVRIAKNGQEAIKQAIAWQPHLIWMDLRMPHMDGYEATRQIKQLSLTPAPIIVALTASAFEEERTRVLEAGCDDFVRKPFQASQIYQTITKFLFDPTTQNGAKSATDLQEQNLSVLRSIAPEDLMSLPPHWLQKLEKAAAKGSDALILQLVEELPANQTYLAQELSNLAQNFQFEHILNLLARIDC